MAPLSGAGMGKLVSLVGGDLERVSEGHNQRAAVEGPLAILDSRQMTRADPGKFSNDTQRHYGTGGFAAVSGLLSAHPSSTRPMLRVWGTNASIQTTNRKGLPLAPLSDPANGKTTLALKGLTINFPR